MNPRDHTAAERARRARLRRQCGLSVYAIEMDSDTLDVLVRRGLIERAAIGDRHELARQLGEAVEQLIFCVTP